MQTTHSANKREQFFPRIPTPDLRPPSSSSSSSLSPTPSRQGRRLSEDGSSLSNFTLTPSFTYKKLTPRDDTPINTHSPSAGVLYHSKSQKENISAIYLTPSPSKDEPLQNNNSLSFSLSTSPSLMPALNLKRVSSPTLSLPPQAMSSFTSSAPPSSHASSSAIAAPMIITSFPISTHTYSPSPVLTNSTPSAPTYDSITIVVPSMSSSTAPLQQQASPTPTSPTAERRKERKIQIPSSPSSTNSSITSPSYSSSTAPTTSASSTSINHFTTATGLSYNANGGNAGSTTNSSGNAGNAVDSIKRGSLLIPPQPPPTPPLPTTQPIQSTSSDQPVQKVICALKEMQDIVSKGFDSKAQAHLLVIGSDKNTVVAALRGLSYSVTLVTNVKDAVRHLRDDDESLEDRKYDVIVLLCDFQSLRDTLPAAALSAIKAVARNLPIIMAINSFHENQIVRLMKEGAQDVVYPPYTHNILKARLHTLLENASLKRKFTQVAQENVPNLTDFCEKFQQTQKKAKMKEFQIKILEEVRTNAEEYIKKLEEQVAGLNEKAASVSQDSQKVKAVNVALKWKMIARQHSSSALPIENSGAPSTPLQKLMAIAKKLDRDISKDEVEFLLYDLSHSGFISPDQLENLDISAVSAETSIDISAVSRIDFCALDLSIDRIITMVCNMFNHLNLLTDFNIPERKFLQFLHTLSNHYNTNPYHNFHHACDVTQMVFFVLVTTNFTTYVSKLDILSLLLAALCHDVEHPGHNNTFQINAKAPLALLYNDVSVLENHHCSHTFQLLRESEVNILESMSEAQFKEVRFNMISSILNTDMSRHFELITKFTTLTQKPAFLQHQPPPSPRAPPSPSSSSSPSSASSPSQSTDVSSTTTTTSSTLTPQTSTTATTMLSPKRNALTSSTSTLGPAKPQMEKADRQVLLDTILHAADISNLVRPWQISKLWCDRLFTEFLNQGDSERELGIPISPYMDRRDTDQVKMSLNFIDFLCHPLYAAVAKAFPTLSICVENMQKNRENWATVRPSSSHKFTAK